MHDPISFIINMYATAINTASFTRFIFRCRKCPASNYSLLKLVNSDNPVYVTGSDHYKRYY